MLPRAFSPECQSKLSFAAMKSKYMMPQIIDITTYPAPYSFAYSGTMYGTGSINNVVMTHPSPLLADPGAIDRFDLRLLMNSLIFTWLNVRIVT